MGERFKVTKSADSKNNVNLYGKYEAANTGEDSADDTITDRLLPSSAQNSIGICSSPSDLSKGK